MRKATPKDIIFPKFRKTNFTLKKEKETLEYQSQIPCKVIIRGRKIKSRITHFTRMINQKAVSPSPTKKQQGKTVTYHFKSIKRWGGGLFY